jgi:hypothetical protein
MRQRAKTFRVRWITNSVDEAVCNAVLVPKMDKSAAAGNAEIGSHGRTAASPVPLRVRTALELPKSPQRWNAFARSRRCVRVARPTQILQPAR